MQLDYIDFASEDGNMAQALFEITEKNKLKEMTAFSFQCNESFIIAIGQKDISEAMIRENIPANTPISRGYKKGNYAGIGAQYYLPGSIYIGFSSKETERISELVELTQSIVNRNLREAGINTFIANNDIYMDDGKNKKKFSGYACTDLGDYITFGLTLSLDVDNEKMDKLYDFNSEKFTKKGKITTTKNIVGGLREIKKDIEYQPLAENIIKDLADRLGYKFKKREATIEEKTAITDLKKILSNEEWGYNGNHPFRKKC